MRYRIACIVLAGCVGVASLVGIWADDQTSAELNPYCQHEDAVRVEDVEGPRREAAMSFDVEAESFATHLPVLNLDCDPASGGTGEMAPVEAELSVLDSGSRANSLEDEPAARMCIALRGVGDSIGASAPVFGAANKETPKRGEPSVLAENPWAPAFAFFAVEEGGAVQSDLLGMGSGTIWLVSGPLLDAGALRPYAAASLASRVTARAPEVRLCEVFVEGSYQGVRMLMESPEASAGRLALTQPSSPGDETSYVVHRVDADSSAALDGRVLRDFLSYTHIVPPSTRLVVEQPGEELAPSQLEWIASDVSAIEKRLYSYDYDTRAYGYWKSLDVDSFVGHAVMCELLAGVIDEGPDCYMRDLKDGLAPVAAWGEASLRKPSDRSGQNTASAEEIGFVMPDRPLYSSLYHDEDFTERVIDRYRSLRRDALSDESIAAVFDDAVAYLGPALERTASQAQRAVTAASAIEDDMRSARDAVLRRAAWLDANIDNIRQFSHESAVKKFNH